MSYEYLFICMQSELCLAMELGDDWRPTSQVLIYYVNTDVIRIMVTPSQPRLDRTTIILSTYN